jgi:hypothetical protein
MSTVPAFCGNGHPLQLTRGLPGVSWRCDACYMNFQPNTVSYSCQSCRVHACDSCVLRVCSSQHVLLRSAPRGAWICDGCKNIRIGESLGCRMCVYDLCLNCVRAPPSATAAGPNQPKEKQVPMTTGGGVAVRTDTASPLAVPADKRESLSARTFGICVRAPPSAAGPNQPIEKKVPMTTGGGVAVADSYGFAAQRAKIERVLEDDDMVLVAQALRQVATRCRRSDVLKADLGNELRHRHPERFHNRDDIKKVLRFAVEDAKILHETGSGATLRVSIVEVPTNVRDMQLVVYSLRQVATRCDRPDVLKADLVNELRRFRNDQEVTEVLHIAVYDANILHQTGSGAMSRVSIVEAPQKMTGYVDAPVANEVPPPPMSAGSATTLPKDACAVMIYQADGLDRSMSRIASAVTTAPTARPGTSATSHSELCTAGEDANTAQYRREMLALLCTEFEARYSDSTRTTVTDKVALHRAKQLVRAPFDPLVRAASNVVELVGNAVVMKRTCARLAGRIARINFIVLKLRTTEGSTDAVLKCADDLTAVFNRAVALLEEFGGISDLSLADLSWIEHVQATCQAYSSSFAGKFVSIHKELNAITAQFTTAFDRTLDPIVAETTLSVTENIRSTDQLAHVLEEFQWLKQENEAADGTDAAEAELRAIIAFHTFCGRSAPQTKFYPCDVCFSKQKIGRGKFAAVYPGVLYGQIEVAVKVFQMYDGALRNVEAEVRRANHARHRNIVHVFGIVLLDDDTVGIVMELLGMSLARALECKKVTEESLRMKYTLDIIAGMQHMHQRVVHFDLKPANILLTHDRRSIKIIDFGVSQTATTMDNDVPTKRGTLPYVAPELFVNPPKSSAACDVYSFAVVLAELWTGTAAWEHLGNDAGMMGYHVSMKGSRPFSPDELKTMRVPAHIVALITKCWAQEPLDRPTFAVLAKLKHTPPADWPTFLDAAA